MIAVDTTPLVYAHREDSPWRAAGFARIAELAESRSPWAIPWPCLHEFLAIVTHPRIYAPPTPLSDALDQVAAWLEAPSLVLLSEADGYWPMLRDTLATARAAGAELVSCDTDLARFKGLRWHNPVAGQAFPFRTNSSLLRRLPQQRCLIGKPGSSPRQRPGRGHHQRRCDLPFRGGADCGCLVRLHQFQGPLDGIWWGNLQWR